MSKRYRFFIILVITALCVVFLAPTVRWYFLVPRDQQALALSSREQIKEYSARTAETSLAALVEAARSGGEVPARLSFLTRAAKKTFRAAKREAPAAWDAAAVLSAFSSREEALDAIETKYRTDVFALKDLQKNAVQLGLDLSGGLSIILQADLAALEGRLGRALTDVDREDAINRALEVLNSRIDRFGLTEPVIRRQGADQIYVEIPGNADSERINSIIMGRGGLNFRLVDEDATNAFNQYYAQNPAAAFDGNGNLLDPSAVPAGVEILGVYRKDQYGIDERVGYAAVKTETGLDGNHIQSAVVDRNNLDGSPEVTFVLDAEGGELFYQLTQANVQKLLAIVLDDRVKSQARIQQPIREQVRLTGFGQEEAENIALVLRTAALPVELEVINQQSIGASLGEDTISQGLYALAGGLALVLIFMVLYYHWAGLNAVIAQVLNFFFMGSVLSAFNFTLTLPSVAGFILTIGMAVDANVIIFERMREERRLGKSRKAAIEAGFGKAFWAIMDSNITTFIAALFLSQLGSGPIQGFAVSLAIGVFSSVFTALFVSRLIFDFGTDVLKSPGLSLGRLGTGGAAIPGGIPAGGK
jgi:preprotein translocase subunit SecD